MGTLDTKGPEIEFVRHYLGAASVEVVVMDAGVLHDPGVSADITAGQVASSGGEDLESLRSSGDRGASLRVMGQGAAAIASEMVGRREIDGSDRPLVAATMFGVTTPAVEVAKIELETYGYGVLVFHATGSGGRAMEALVRYGFFAGVLDLTTTEISDEVVGGVLSAGAGRLTGAASIGLPQVVNVGPRDTVTLVRTTAQEAKEIGRAIGTRVGASTSPVVSVIDVPDGPFSDEGADQAAVTGLRSRLADSDIEVVVRDDNINDPQVAVAMAQRLHELIQGDDA